MKIKRLWLAIITTLTSCASGVNGLNNQANSLYRGHSYQEALRAYQIALANQPDFALLYYNISASLFALGDFTAAMGALNLAITLGDQQLQANAHYNLGIIYFQQSRYEEAAEAFRQALIINPQDADARYNYELALLFDLPPTPTALEQKIEPEEGETDPNATPTPNPVDNDGPTPTPTPPDIPPPDPSQTPLLGNVGELSGPTPGTPLPRPSATLSIEEAQRQLDIIEQNQRTLREFDSIAPTPDGTPTGKEW